MPKEGWDRKEMAWYMCSDEYRARSSPPTSLPSALVHIISCHPPNHLSILAEGRGVNSGKMHKHLGEGRLGCRRGDGHLCREKGKAGKKGKGQKLVVQELDKLSAPGGAPGCPQEMYQPCSSLSLSPLFFSKWIGKENNFFFQGKYQMTKKSEATHCFYFFTFSHCISWPTVRFCIHLLHKTASHFLKYVGGLSLFRETRTHPRDIVRRESFKARICLSIILFFQKVATISSHHEAIVMGSAGDCCRGSTGTQIN